MDKEYIKQALKKHQTLLGLSDWDITVGFFDARSLDQYSAKTKIQPNVLCADIRLMDMADRQACDPADKDPELDLIHELIHVRLWAIDPTGKEDCEPTLYICAEQSIESIARAIYNLSNGR